VYKRQALEMLEGRFGEGDIIEVDADPEGKNLTFQKTAEAGEKKAAG